MHRSRRARAFARPIDYETLAELRYQVRRFLRVRELAARASGVAPQQYLVLLQIRGVAARQAVTIGVLAERLQIHHHSAVQLVDRLAGQGPGGRRGGGRDRRSGAVALPPRGGALVREPAPDSLARHKTEGPALAAPPRRLGK